MIEIRLHGRGGQGVVIASRILATAAYEEGKYSQAIPMYGTERRGAPLTAFVRINNIRIRERELVHNPDIILVLDPLLSKEQAVIYGLKKGGLVILNTKDKPIDISLGGDFKVATVDATGIALDTLGIAITNTSILGAFIKVTELLKLNSLEKSIRKYFPKNENNIIAVRRSYEEVLGPIQAVITDTIEIQHDLHVGGYGVLKDVSSWRILTPKIDYNKCTGCKACWIFCPETAIQWNEEKNKPLIEYHKCKGCGICENECPIKCINMLKVEE